MANGLEVGVLDFNILKRRVIDNGKSLKILAPKLEQIIYYGWSDTASGIEINHLKILEMLPVEVHAKDVGFAADLMNRPIRPPKGITIYSAGETLMSGGYVVDIQTLRWVIKSLGMIMEQNGVGTVTLDR